MSTHYDWCARRYRPLSRTLMIITLQCSVVFACLNLAIAEDRSIGERWIYESGTVSPTNGALPARLGMGWTNAPMASYAPLSMVGRSSSSWFFHKGIGGSGAISDAVIS